VLDHPMLKPMSVDHVDADDPGDIVVTGVPYTFDGSMGDFYPSSGQGGYSSNQQEPPEGPRPSPPDVYCQNPATMTPQELHDYKVNVEAANVARDILAMPDHDNVEYGSFIYEDGNGNMHHTALARGSSTSIPQSAYDMTGVTSGYANVVGYIHSHPEAAFTAPPAGHENDPTYTQYLLYPSAHTSANSGDWDFNDWVGDQIYNSHFNSGGTLDAIEASSFFRQYIVGYSDENGVGSYGTYGYAFDDRDVSTLGAHLSSNLGLC